MNESSQDYEPPHSIQAERSVLGGLMIDNSKLAIVCEIVKESDFYDSAHRDIFSAIQALASDNTEIDLITVSEKLEYQGKLEQAGGMRYVGEICRDTPSAANVKNYAEIVRDRSVLRQIIGACHIAIDKAKNPEGRSTKDILANLSTDTVKLSGLFDDKKGGLVPIKDILSTMVDNLEERFESDNSFTGLETGFIDLDKKTRGLQDSDLIIIGGRPSMGKSTVLQNFVEYIAAKNQNSPIALFSIEMPAEIMAIRMIASLGRIELSRLLSGNLENDDWARLTSAINILAKSKVFIDESSYLPIQTYSARLAKLAAEHGKIAFIGVDYLQLMDAPEHKNNMVQKIGAISRGLKMSAKVHECPVVALSQLSRNVESRTDKRPMMSDLRESGQIEQDADLIMFVYRDEVYNEDSTDKGKAEFIIAKSRNGEIGTVRMTCNLAYARFENFAGMNYDENNYN